MDEFSRLGLCSVIDRFLGLRCKTIGYQYSEIISSLFCIYYCGGDCIEEIGIYLGNHLALRPNTRIPSPNTLLRGIKELSEDNVSFRSKQGLEYSFNKVERLGALLLELLLHTGQLVKDKQTNIEGNMKTFPNNGERGKCEVMESIGTKKTIKNKIKGGITKLKSAKENHTKCCGF